MRLAVPQQGREYLAMVSYFRLKGLGVMPKFLWNSLRIERQLLRSEGLVGHSSGARLGSFEFWSTTVWEDERTLEKFVRAFPHREIMEAMKPHVVRSEFVRWTVNGGALPPSRGDAEGKLRRALAAS